MGYISISERTVLLRYNIFIPEGVIMRARKKEKTIRINLLEISDVERSQTLEKAKESLRQKIAEAKLFNSFLELENITVNGEKINCGDCKLTGLSPTDI
jgi:hypothetical protein